MASPVTAFITVVGSMSPGLNFMAFPLILAILNRFTAFRLNPDNVSLSGVELVCRGDLV
jgi:hypothetical protein